MSATDEKVDLDGLVAMIQDDDRLYGALERMVQFQEEALEEGSSWEQYEHAGFDAGDVGLVGWEIPKFLDTGILTRSYRSGNSKQFRLGARDRDAPEGDQWTHFTEEAIRALELANREVVDLNEDLVEDLDELDVDELFTDIVGRDEEKKWIRRTIEKRRRIHHLLVGPSGSGKSQMLDDVLRLPRAARFVGSGRSSTAAGMSNFLLDHKPLFLVIEEIEKMAQNDAEALLTLMGQAFVETTKGDGTKRQEELETIVFANANDLDRVSPDSLVSRMMVWEFDPYTLEEYVDVCTTVLPRDEEVGEQLAKYIAERVFHDLDSSDVRDAIRIGALAETEDEVDELVEAMGTRQSKF